MSLPLRQYGREKTMNTFDFKKVEIRKGFVRDLQKLNAEVSVYNVYKRFEETGRFRALKCEKRDEPTHIF